MITRDSNIDGLDRATLPLSRSKRILRAAIHLLSYHFILKRRRTTLVRIAPFRLTVRPTVFHPRYFLTSKFFADFLSGIDLDGKRVADVGTGSGILASRQPEREQRVYSRSTSTPMPRWLRPKMPIPTASPSQSWR
jgi:methylase of polypeptide subunit release factors